MGFTLTIKKRHLTFLLVFIVVLGAGVVLAQQTWPAVGHPKEQIEPCANGEILQIVSGAWECRSIPAASTPNLQQVTDVAHTSSNKIGLHDSSVGSDEGYGGRLVITRAADQNPYINLIRAGNAVWSLGFLTNDPDPGQRNNFAIGGGALQGAALAINPNGYVGIGTSSPAYKLSVNGDIAGNGKVLPAGVAGFFGEYLETVGGDLVFGAGNVERVRIKNGGNVGIGTNDPTEKLDVYGNVRIASGNRLKFGPVNSGESIVSDQTDYNLMFFTNFLQRMTIANNGNVGIGTSTPTQKLDVIGNERIVGDEVVTGNSMVGGNLDVVNGRDLTFTASGTSPQNPGDVLFRYPAPSGELIGRIFTTSGTGGLHRVWITAGPNGGNGLEVIGTPSGMTAGMALRLPLNPRAPFGCTVDNRGAMYFDIDHAGGAFQIPCVCSYVQSSGGWNWRGVDNFDTICA